MYNKTNSEDFPKNKCRMRTKFDSDYTREKQKGINRIHCRIKSISLWCIMAWTLTYYQIWICVLILSYNCCQNRGMSSTTPVQHAFREECELCRNAGARTGPFYTRRLFRNHIIFFHNYDIDRRRNELGQWQDYLVPIDDERLEHQQRRVFLKSAPKRYRQIVYNELQQKAHSTQLHNTARAGGSGCDVASSHMVHTEQSQTTSTQPRTHGNLSLVRGFSCPSMLA